MEQLARVPNLKTPAPGSLSFGNDAQPSPPGDLEAIGDGVQGKVVVTHQTRPSVPTPYCLAAAADNGRRPVVADDLACSIVITDKGANPIVVRLRLWHVVGHAARHSALVGASPRPLPRYELIRQRKRSSHVCPGRSSHMRRQIALAWTNS